MNQQTTTGFRPFKQIPEWKDDEQFVLTGAQLKAIQRMFEAYTPFTKAIEPVFIQGLNEGKITIRYEDLEGNPMEKEEVDTMLRQFAQEMAAQMNQPKTEE